MRYNVKVRGIFACSCLPLNARRGKRGYAICGDACACVYSALLLLPLHPPTRSFVRGGACRRCVPCSLPFRCSCAPYLILHAPLCGREHAACKCCALWCAICPHVLEWFTYRGFSSAGHRTLTCQSSVSANMSSISSFSLSVPSTISAAPCSSSMGAITASSREQVAAVRIGGLTLTTSTSSSLRLRQCPNGLECHAVVWKILSSYDPSPVLRWL